MCRLDRNRAATFIHSIKKKRKEKKKRKKERGGAESACIQTLTEGLEKVLGRFVVKHEESRLASTALYSQPYGAWEVQ